VPRGGLVRNIIVASAGGCHALGGGVSDNDGDCGAVPAVSAYTSSEVMPYADVC
jgi:hypothetical protein